MIFRNHYVIAGSLMSRVKQGTLTLPEHLIPHPLQMGFIVWGVHWQWNFPFVVLFYMIYEGDWPLSVRLLSFSIFMFLVIMVYITLLSMILSLIMILISFLVFKIPLIYVEIYVCRFLLWNWYLSSWTCHKANDHIALYF